MLVVPPNTWRALAPGQAGVATTVRTAASKWTYDRMSECAPPPEGDVTFLVGETDGSRLLYNFIVCCSISIIRLRASRIRSRFAAWLSGSAPPGAWLSATLGSHRTEGGARLLSTSPAERDRPSLRSDGLTCAISWPFRIRSYSERWWQCLAPQCCKPRT